MCVAMTQTHEFMSRVAAITSQGPEKLSSLGAGILAAVVFDVAHDSRAFANKLGIAHALIIRECIILSEELGLLLIKEQNHKTMRISYSLTEAGYSCTRLPNDGEASSNAS